MVIIVRQISDLITKDFFKGKIITLLGARQVGKSTLIRNLELDSSWKLLWLDGDNADVVQLFENPNVDRLLQITMGYNILVIDEAQRIKDIGRVLKLYADYHKHIQVIASGSSAFELRQTLNEPLTGRKFEYHLFPFSFEEMKKHTDLLKEIRKLPQRLIYGYYPEIVTNELDAERLLKLLSESYLYKDIFLFRGLKKPEKILELLKLLAWQIGSEVNFNELSNTLKIDNQTVESYVQLLEQSFVIYRLSGYHTNQRNELKKAKKIYFNDLGIRNAIINDFRQIENRNDKGALFENFMVNEIKKQNEYLGMHANLYFWRSADQKEIDLIIEKNNHLHALEFKFSGSSKVKKIKSFENNYPNSTFYLVTQENFHSYATSELADLIKI